MEFRPFSPIELSNLSSLIEKEGWKINGFIENYFRYSLHKNKILIFSIKFPVNLPAKLNVPLEVACFRISIAFKLWILDEKSYKIIIYLLKMLKNLAEQVSIENNFVMNDKDKAKLINLLNKVLPDLIKNENEKSWLNRIRISLMNKRELFQKYEANYLKELIEIIEKSGLKPTFNQPWELKEGLPKIRASEALFFTNNESKDDEYFILEKDYITYFKDMIKNKFYIRSLFESYCPFILQDLYNDNPNFDLKNYTKNWIKFVRILLNSILDIFNLEEINNTDLIQFRPEKELTQNNFEEDENNFPFSALHYETLISKDLFPLNYDLFNKPPTAFEVIESASFVKEAKELIKDYKFEDASILLEESLKIFNKYRQKKLVVTILLTLRKIASVLNQDTIALNYLKNALEVAKSGGVPVELVMKVHYKLGKYYFKREEYENAITHFKILQKFLLNEDVKLENINRYDYLGMTYLYLGLIQLSQNDSAQYKDNLKNAFQIGNSNSTKVRLKYHLYRAIFFKNKEKYSQALKILKNALSDLDLSEKLHQNAIVDILLEICEFYILHRKDSKKALYYLETTEKLISLKTIPQIQRAIRWNNLMSDYYKFVAKDSDNSAFYLSQSRNLRAQLKAIGYLE
jgi:hypothetical protein